MRLYFLVDWNHADTFHTSITSDYLLDQKILLYWEGPRRGEVGLLPHPPRSWLPTRLPVHLSRNTHAYRGVAVSPSPYIVNIAVTLLSIVAVAFSLNVLNVVVSLFPMVLSY